MKGMRNEITEKELEAKDWEVGEIIGNRVIEN
jgi:hypothetical protein